MHFIVFLGLGYIALFLIPASIRNTKWFLGIWGGCAAGIAYGFILHKARDDVADPLAQMFDRALLDICAVACGLALCAWVLRRVAEFMKWQWYHHWPVLLLGSIAVPVAFFARFTQ